MQENLATAPRKQTQERVATTLDERLERKLAAARRYRGTILFFKNHRSLLGSERHRDTGDLALGRAKHRLAQVTKTIRALRAAI